MGPHEIVGHKESLMEIITQGKGWLQEGESAVAVVEEAKELIKAASDKKTEAAWLVVAAEALILTGAVEEALDLAAQAMATFVQLSLRACEVAAALAVASAHVLRQDWDDAIGALMQALAASHDSGDRATEAEVTLKLAKAYLMQMKDPFTAAEAAVTSTKLFKAVGNKIGEAEAFKAAAEAHLLYDPAQALKAAKQAAALADESGNPKVRAFVAPVLAAAKAQVALSQHAALAQSQSGRGDMYVAHKWPCYAQQRGARVPDLFVVNEYRTSAPGSATTAKANAASFTRRSFKWTSGRHATDEAWYRQELRLVQPRFPQKVLEE